LARASSDVGAFGTRASFTKSARDFCARGTPYVVPSRVAAASAASSKSARSSGGSAWPAGATRSFFFVGPEALVGVDEHVGPVRVRDRRLELGRVGVEGQGEHLDRDAALLLEGREHGLERRLFFAAVRVPEHEAWLVGDSAPRQNEREREREEHEDHAHERGDGPPPGARVVGSQGELGFVVEEVHVLGEGAPSKKFIAGLPRKLATKRVFGLAYTSSGWPACSTTPLLRMKITSARVIASTWSWVTYTLVAPSSS
jgi:hypothetical protein